MSGDCRLVHAPHRADSRIASLCSATLRSGFWDSSCASFIRNSSGRLEYFSSVDATKRRSFGNPARARFCACVCVCVCVCVHGPRLYRGNNVSPFDPAVERAEKCSILQKNRARLPEYLYFSP